MSFHHGLKLLQLCTIKITKIMKNSMFSLRVFFTGLTMLTLVVFSVAQSNPKPVAAVIGIDCKGILPDHESVGYMVRLELEKTDVYTVMDKYDVTETIKKNKIDGESCYGKTCVVAAGKVLGVDKMITGSIERFGEKIIISMKVIDIKTESVEKQSTIEYLNLQPELQKMIRISIQKLLGLSVDQAAMDMLINYDMPIISPQSMVRLNGPRMGASMAFGDVASVMKAPESQGGYNMYPTNFTIGWQLEKQYISAGNFQALVEFIPAISGLESGRVIPSVTFLNGLRMGKAGWEFAFGPNPRLVNKADGFFDVDNKLGAGANAWHLQEDWTSATNPYPIVSRLDSRGMPTLSTGLFIGFGRTFKSGYLNIPVNVYVIPRKEGSVAGFSFGFNIQKKKRVQ